MSGAVQQEGVSCPVYWPRAIILMDMNAFFASVEQRDFPALRGRPVAITNSDQGTTIITSSYEARAAGVKTGMRLKEARRLCPELIRRPARSSLYARISGTIMAGLHDICPDIEVFSVDEAFIDVSHCQRLRGTPPRIARMVKQRVWELSGLHCSVGVSGDKTTAKFAAKLQKPDGLVVIPPWEARQWLADVPTTELSGIARGIGSFLASHGVYRCGDMQKLPISVLGSRFGNLGRRIWLMCQGEDPEQIQREVAPPKSIGHGKVLPPGTREREVLLTYFLHMSEKVGARLRRHNLEAKRFLVGWKEKTGWVGDKPRLPVAGNDGRAIFRLCCFVLENRWHNAPVYQIQVTALDPRPARQQLELFTEDASIHRDNPVMDAVNTRYGAFSLSPARLLKRTTDEDVIAPAWKPSGHRKTV